MLNKTDVVKKTYTNVPDILFATMHQVSMGIVVSKEAGAVTENGKQIIKAGTPLTGDLDNRTTPFTAASAGSESALSDVVGILLHDVDVTVDDANGTLLLFGFVNLDRVDTATQAKITANIKEALPMIKLVHAD